MPLVCEAAGSRSVSVGSLDVSQSVSVISQLVSVLSVVRRRVGAVTCRWARSPPLSVRGVCVPPPCRWRVGVCLEVNSEGVSIAVVVGHVREVPS